MMLEPCSPWPRQVLSHEEWGRLASDPAPPLLALWADTRDVYALLRQADTDPLLISTHVESGGYPALSPTRPLAAWFERMIRDLWGHLAVGGIDQRPWLDHGTWPQTTPMAMRPAGLSASAETAEPAADANDWDQIPIGPVRGLIEPAAHLRLFGHGERIARLEARLGYTHKGALVLMRGKSPRAAARFAARLCGEATVAHSIAFAQATEAALGCEIPARAASLRGVMAELERIANHLELLAAVGEVTERQLLTTRCAWHGEAVRRGAQTAFGHRLMMDCVIPGGLAADAAPEGPEAIRRSLRELADELGEIERLMPVTGHLAGIGILPATPGVADCAAGVGGDLRVSPGYGAYKTLAVAAPIGSEGDAAARLRLRLMEIKESIRLVRDLVASAPSGAVSVALPSESGEGIGFAQAPSGEVWHWLRLDHGQIASVFMRDPAWLLWPMLEQIMKDGQADDLELVLASLGLSSSGADL